jgi:hypothetical protein
MYRIAGLEYLHSRTGTDLPFAYEPCPDTYRPIKKLDERCTGKTLDKYVHRTYYRNIA